MAGKSSAAHQPPPPPPTTDRRGLLHCAPLSWSPSSCTPVFSSPCSRRVGRASGGAATATVRMPTGSVIASAAVANRSAGTIVRVGLLCLSRLACQPRTPAADSHNWRGLPSRRREAETRRREPRWLRRCGRRHCRLAAAMRYGRVKQRTSSDTSATAAAAVLEASSMAAAATACWLRGRKGKLVGGVGRNGMSNEATTRVGGANCDPTWLAAWPQLTVATGRRVG